MYKVDIGESLVKVVVIVRATFIMCTNNTSWKEAQYGHANSSHKHKVCRDHIDSEWSCSQYSSHNSKGLWKEKSSSRSKSADESDSGHSRCKRIHLSNHCSNSRRATGAVRGHIEKKIYEDQYPTTTIIIKGLVQSVTENDIWKEVMHYNILPADVRLIRNKETGELRGFAFLVFRTIQESTYFMDINKGELILEGKCKTSMEYSIPRDCPNFDRNPLKLSQCWCCVLCGFNNYTCRDVCYRCKAPCEKSLETKRDEICPYPTNTVLLRCLDVLSTEDSVLSSLKGITSLPIRKIQIGQDALTKTSRGVCYIEMNSIADSIKLYNVLTSEPFIVDNKKVTVCYCKSVSANPPLTSAHMKVDLLKNTDRAKLNDIVRLAECGASLYATTPQEHEIYLKYYKQYYEMQLKQKGSTEIIGQPCVQLTAGKVDTNNSNAPAKYSVPDVSKYTYDKTSGYYYDAQTGFYYDASSQYYYNPKLQQFLYWDLDKLTYTPVTQSSNLSKCNGKKDTEKNKEDKIKVAKKIVKEMERWAKVLNEKRDIARQNIILASTPSKSVGSADAGFTVLERKETVNDDSGSVTALSRIIAYDSGNESEDAKDDYEQHINWKKLACLLCKRQFQTKESLAKHQQLSDLHQQNLDKWQHNQSKVSHLESDFKLRESTAVNNGNTVNKLPDSGWHLGMSFPKQRAGPGGCNL